MMRKMFTKRAAATTLAALALAGLTCAALLIGGMPAWADSQYRLHGGDVLNVVVYGEQTLTGPVTVLPDGTIDLALIGKVSVAGQTPEQAAATIKHALEKYIRHPVVTVSVTQVGQVNVMVLGDVKTPGKYPLPPTATLTDAIAAAGGINPIEGPYPDAKIGLPGGQTTQVSLQKLLHDGDTSLNVPLQDGSIVYIPAPATISVQVVGSVDHPGEVDVREGDRLSMAIALAGASSAANSDLNNITVTRTLPDGKSEAIHVNLYKTLEGGDLSKDLVLQKGDIVYVPSMKGRSPNGGGGILNSGLYYLFATLRSFIPIP
jgi:polysaccharide export outer membrane protein